jgi:hypothetical protein
VIKSASPNKQRLREAKELGKEHTAVKKQSLACNPSYSRSRDRRIIIQSQSDKSY